jgi:hypothetical protein
MARATKKSAASEHVETAIRTAPKTGQQTAIPEAAKQTKTGKTRPSLYAEKTVAEPVMRVETQPIASVKPTKKPATRSSAASENAQGPTPSRGKKEIAAASGVLSAVRKPAPKTDSVEPVKSVKSTMTAKSIAAPKQTKAGKSKSAAATPAKTPRETKEPAGSLRGGPFHVWKDSTRRGMAYVEGKENAERLLTVLGRPLEEATKKRGDKTEVPGLYAGVMAVYSDKRGRPFAWQIPFEIACWDRITALVASATV